MNIDPSWQKLLNDVLAAIMPLLVLIVGYLVSDLVHQATALISHKLSQTQMQTVEHWTRLGVFAAEQFFHTADGAVKKEYAVKWIVAQLRAHGLPVDEVEIDDLIEAIVGQEALNLSTVHLPHDEAGMAPPPPMPVPDDPGAAGVNFPPSVVFQPAGVGAK